ncbi:HSP20-like chaperone [Phakopsora pachyrhizi]|uniref:Nuclear movement protein nudC n=1 Tax=Phakopsora pachyrhizi TaxID=170000 RepID=A0AAV0BJR7_PHAPC|nr:HSP20-like chaperone [Phakopsora pachyrhizi]
MVKLTPTEYDALSPEERKAHDERESKREQEEQAALPFNWKQTLQDVSLVIPVPPGTKSRDLVVEIKKKTLKVCLKGKEPILEGDLCKDVKVEDSTWCLVDNKVINLHLEKVNQMTWWENVLTHHPKIDTTKINPENSKLSELDGETRAMVEKMMFDNQQKQLGKPTSDEQKKLGMLEKFKAAHPEMDFSNAKIG